MSIQRTPSCEWRSFRMGRTTMTRVLKCLVCGFDRHMAASRRGQTSLHLDLFPAVSSAINFRPPAHTSTYVSSVMLITMVCLASKSIRRGCCKHKISMVGRGLKRMGRMSPSSRSLVHWKARRVQAQIHNMVTMHRPIDRTFLYVDILATQWWAPGSWACPPTPLCVFKVSRALHERPGEEVESKVSCPVRR